MIADMALVQIHGLVGSFMSVLLWYCVCNMLCHYSLVMVRGCTGVLSIAGSRTVAVWAGFNRRQCCVTGITEYDRWASTWVELGAPHGSRAGLVRVERRV